MCFDDYFDFSGGDAEELRRQVQAESDKLSEQIKAFERSMWQSNTFCDCGADQLKDCICDKQDRQRFVEKLNTKKRAIFQNRGAKLSMLRNEFL